MGQIVLLKAEYYSVWADILHFVHPFIHQWALALLPPLDHVNNAAVNMGVQISLTGPAFSSSVCTPRSGVAESSHTYF